MTSLLRALYGTVSLSLVALIAGCASGPDESRSSTVSSAQAVDGEDEEAPPPEDGYGAPDENYAPEYGADPGAIPGYGGAGVVGPGYGAAVGPGYGSPVYGYSVGGCGPYGCGQSSSWSAQSGSSCDSFGCVYW